MSVTGNWSSHLNETVHNTLTVLQCSMIYCALSSLLFFPSSKSKTSPDFYHATPYRVHSPGWTKCQLKWLFYSGRITSIMDKMTFWEWLLLTPFIRMHLNCKQHSSKSWYFLSVLYWQISVIEIRLFHSANCILFLISKSTRTVKVLFI